jgi:hypothetical protein
MAADVIREKIAKQQRRHGARGLALDNSEDEVADAISSQRIRSSPA